MIEVYAKNAVLGVLALSLSACATNAIRLDRASTMVKAGQDATKATTDLMNDTRSENRNVLVSLVAVDPNCIVPEPSIAPPNKKAPYLCPRRGETGTPLARITRADFAPTLAVVEGLSAYLDKVDEVVTRDPATVSGDIETAYNDLQVFQNAALGVAGSKAKPLALTSDQLDAVKGALSLLDTILDEQDRVNDLRVIESSENRKNFHTSIEALKRANNFWLNSYDTQLSNRIDLLKLQLDRKLQRASAERRKPVVDDLYTAIERSEQVAELQAAFMKLADTLDQAHSKYLELLDNDKAKLTKKERAKLAKLNHDRVIGALKSLTGLIAAF